MTVERMSLRRRVAWLLDYEPTWFPELAGGVAILGWSVACCLTDDYRIAGAAWLLPAAGLIFGPMRWFLLLRLWWTPRVVAAALGAVWWSWIVCGVVRQWGWVPQLGPMVAILVLDLLTMARFSVPCARDLVLELRDRRARR